MRNFVVAEGNENKEKNVQPSVKASAGNPSAAAPQKDADKSPSAPVSPAPAKAPAATSKPASAAAGAATKASVPAQAEGAAAKPSTPKASPSAPVSPAPAKVPAAASKSAPAKTAPAGTPAMSSAGKPATVTAEKESILFVSLSEGESRRSRKWRKIRRALKSPWLLLVIVPTVLAFIYFLLLASPMYVSNASFAIRSANASSSSGMDIASVFLKTSGSTGNDTYILNDYIQSLDIAQDIDRELGIVAHYSSHDHDIISRLWSHPTQNELARYWRWAVVPQLNVDTGIISLEVKAYTPQMAQQITEAVLSRSEALVNAMNKRAQSDAVALASKEVQRAEERVRNAQSSMREFRDAHNLIDPKVTAEGLQGLVTGLEAEATTLRTQISEARSYMKADAPLIKSLTQRLAAVEKQLDEEKLRVAGQNSTQGNLNSLVAAYEDLTIEAEFAQKQLVSAMTSLEQARIQQMAQSRYVVAYQQPTLPDESLYPRPFLFTLYVFAGLLLLMGIVSLVWASIREHAGF